MLQNKTILLIDDDPIANLINTKVIEMSSHFKVVEAINADYALEQLKQWAISTDDQFPEIIFLDVNMPVMNGWDFLKEFQKLPASIVEKCKVFILSSSIDPQDIQKSKLYACVQEFISKPLTPEKMGALQMETICNLKK